jgi:YYY domain-containing protein
MSEAIRWWLVLQLVALPLLPLCLAMFPGLRERGYALSKPFGLLLLGYTFWLLNGFGIVPNSPGGIVLSLLLLAILAGAVAYVRRDDLLDWARQHWRYMLGVEALLLVTFGVAVWLRSLVGIIGGTEQPMDLMFLNAVTRAESFPPQDPWLAGHTVVYYYFGYLIVGMVGTLAGVPPEIGYNIGLGMVASLAFVASFGVVYNLVAIREQAVIPDVPPRPDEPPLRGYNWRPAAFAIAGGLLLAVIGNLVYFFHFLSAFGIGGSRFYDWLNVQGLEPDLPREGLVPGQFFGFFSPSRIYPINDDGFRAITEFPMFSFMLGDLHPHVMALPFVVLVVGLALSLFRSREPLDITFWLQRPLMLVGSAILLGGLAFLNTWDVLTLAFVVLLAAFVSNFLRVRALTGDLFMQVISFALPLGLLAVVLYIPFYTNFESQQGGIGAVVSNSGVTDPGTRPLHLLLFWGPLFAVVVPLALARLAAARERLTAPAVALSFAPAAAVVVLWAFVYAYQRATGDDKLRDAGGFFTQIADRGIGWVTALVIGALLAGAVLALWTEMTSRDEREERSSPTFALALAATGFLLILGTEFFFVGDVFNNRMNTVFKLYYQAWALLALSAGMGLYYLASHWRLTFRAEQRFRYAWATVVVVFIGAALLYPLGGTYNRVRPWEQDTGLLGAQRSLHGLRHFPAEELAAIDWLRNVAEHQELVVAEAVGGSYTRFGRISGTTGIPTVLSWPGHQNQWRGTSEPFAGREDDMQRLYGDGDLSAVAEVVEKYGITHIYVGPLERETYGNGPLSKFEGMPVVFQEGAVTIYRASTLVGEVGNSR